MNRTNRPSFWRRRSARPVFSAAPQGGHHGSRGRGGQGRGDRRAPGRRQDHHGLFEVRVDDLFSLFPIRKAISTRAVSFPAPTT